MQKILIIEDEIEISKILASYLEKAAYQVISAARGDQGLSLWEHSKPDLILLDINMPGMDGLEVAREIRKKSDIPIIMITARVEESDKLIGLELGADDYVTKPFSPREVVARVKTVLRRSNPKPQTNQILREMDLEIDLEAHAVRQNQKLLDLTPTEFTILVTLVNQPGRVFSRLQLLEASQGDAYEGYERTIDAHIKNLRSKLECDSHSKKYIETVFGVGYRFRKE
jgi:two-component system alkaline phosphatase synthesis response regulator PhoP